MDEMLDPDFYLTYSTTPSRFKPRLASMGTIPPRDHSAPNPIIRPKTEEIPKAYRPVKLAESTDDPYRFYLSICKAHKH